MQRRNLLVALCALAAVALAGMPSPDPFHDSCVDVPPTELEDGLRWRRNPSAFLQGAEDALLPLLDAAYTEWDFFTVYDPKLDLGLAFSLSVGGRLDDLSNPSVSLSGAAALLFQNVSAGKDANVQAEAVNFAGSLFNASTTRADVSVGERYIHVENASTYHTRSWTQTFDSAWQLTYHKLAPGAQQSKNVGPVHVDWLSYMPSARVTGTVTINGTAHEIDAIGYHDHNFGVWPHFMFAWVWANFPGSPTDADGDRLALVIGGMKIQGAMKALEPGRQFTTYVFIRWGDVHLKISDECDGSQTALTPMEYVQVCNDAGVCKPTSIHNKYTASNKEWKLVVDWRKRAQIHNPGGDFLHILNVEQVSWYEGQLLRNIDGKWTVVKSFEGHGFSEWSSTYEYEL